MNRGLEFEIHYSDFEYFSFLSVARDLPSIHHRPIGLRHCFRSYCNKRLFKFHESSECKIENNKKSYLDMSLRSKCLIKMSGKSWLILHLSF